MAAASVATVEPLGSTDSTCRPATGCTQIKIVTPKNSGGGRHITSSVGTTLRHHTQTLTHLPTRSQTRCFRDGGALPGLLPTY